MEGMADADSCRRVAGAISRRPEPGGAPGETVFGERTVTSTNGPTLRVVVADDCPAARASQLALLDAVGGVQVVGFAANGRQAVNAVHATRPDAVFLDIAMPVMDGLQAAAVIGSRHSDVRIIVHSPFDPSAMTSARRSGGSVGYFRTARTTAELLDQLRQLFPTHGWAIHTQAPANTAHGSLTKSLCTACSARSGHCQSAAWDQQTSRTFAPEYGGVRCIDAADVRWQVDRTLRWVNPQGFDVPAIVAEIIHTYGLVDVCESVTFVDYSTLVMRHYRE